MEDKARQSSDRSCDLSSVSETQIVTQMSSYAPRCCWFISLLLSLVHPQGEREKLNEQGKPLSYLVFASYDLLLFFAEYQTTK